MEAAEAGSRRADLLVFAGWRLVEGGACALQLPQWEERGRLDDYKWNKDEVGLIFFFKDKVRLLDKKTLFFSFPRHTYI